MVVTAYDLFQRERDSLNLLASDKNIAIKPSGKCGKNIFLDTDDYEKACLDIFTNTESCEELSYEPNYQYIGKELTVRRKRN